MTRSASVSRNTNETKIEVSINLDGQGSAKLNTGIGFLDHMLDQVARHGMFDLEVTAKGDLHIDAHHTVEDVGIVLGQAFNKAIGDKDGLVDFYQSSQIKDLNYFRVDGTQAVEAVFRDIQSNL